MSYATLIEELICVYDSSPLFMDPIDFDSEEQEQEEDQDEEESQEVEIKIQADLQN